ncbi:hypothetical protein [Aureivirga sp. CE67]|uniref:hypothetical protein n=1 Tax=Aureivirga sp. CE67 TaxID=1788983 RepID=UPI0018CBA764|nr:hypothetical protein [Aureivirga sp. CE67]
MKRVLMTALLCCSIAMSAQEKSDNIKEYFDPTKIDLEDVQEIFEDMGYVNYKYPIKLKKGEILNVVIEEYEKGKLKSSKTMINKETINQFNNDGIDYLSYVTPKFNKSETEKTFTYKFRTFEKGNENLRIIPSIPGSEEIFNFDLSKIVNGSLNCEYSTVDIIDEKGFLEVKEKTLLLFYYGIQDRKSNILLCSSGIEKEKLLKRYDYLIFVYLEPYQR